VNCNALGTHRLRREVPDSFCELSIGTVVACRRLLAHGHRHARRKSLLELSFRRPLRESKADPGLPWGNIVGKLGSVDCQWRRRFERIAETDGSGFDLPHKQRAPSGDCGVILDSECRGHCSALTYSISPDWSRTPHRNTRRISRLRTPSGEREEQAAALYPSQTPQRFELDGAGGNSESRLRP
jgi:hypothetical protein